MSTQVDRVVAELRGRILTGQLAPGERVVELKFTEQLDVSRTPLRLALGELEREGLLERLPTRGFRVRSFSMDQIADAVDVRGTLEGMAARLVAERRPDPELLAQLEQCLQTGQRLIDEAVAAKAAIEAHEWSEMNLRFHLLLVRGSGNRAIEPVVAFLSRTPMAGAGALTLQGVIPALETAFIQRAQNDHVDVVDAIRQGAGARAEAIMREHALRSRQNKRILVARLAAVT
ncbi:MAG TPA: GntR family transcriptional regulator [Ramlibacter sp.]|nr:GntR family transcriptional regulator [Ramlibacter sp.]